METNKEEIMFLEETLTDDEIETLFSSEDQEERKKDDNETRRI